MRDNSWWAYALELEARGDALALIRKRSPDWEGTKPQLFLGLISADPDERFADGFGSLGMPEARDSALRIRKDILCAGPLTKEEAYRARTEANLRLRREGFGLINAEPRRSHRVYVIELDPAVRERKEVREANPHADPDMPCVYVGQTGLSLRKRRRQHREGRKAGRGYVTKYGFGRPYLRDLFEHLNPCRPEDSLKHERELAAELRARGYTVTGGH